MPSNIQNRHHTAPRANSLPPTKQPTQALQTHKAKSAAASHKLAHEEVRPATLDRSQNAAISTHTPAAHVPTRMANETRNAFVQRALLESHQTVMRLDPQAAATKLERLEQSPFVFFRGTAFLFYADLAQTERQRPVVLCNGDVHPLNFGTMPGRNGEPVFGLNDFDEATSAPFSFDVKRGAVGFHLMAAEAGLKPTECQHIVTNFVESYVETLQKCRGGDREDLALTADRSEGPVKKLLHRAADLSHKKFLKDYARDGRFVSDAEFVPCRERIPEFKAAMQTYLDSLPVERQPEKSALKIKDIVQKQGSGTGSLGAARYFVLVEGLSKKDKDDVLLEFKQALPSVLTPYSGTDAITLRAGGARVAGAQDIQVAQGDPLFGSTVLDGKSFFVRQRSEAAQRFEPEQADFKDFRQYAKSCGEALAQAHARSRNHAEERILKSIDATSFVDEVTTDTQRLAEHVLGDYQLFIEAKRDGAYAL